MRNAETVTFGGPGLDRAAHLRGDVNALRSDPAARTILFWRGKIMVSADHTSLLRVALDHPAAVGPAIYLGHGDAGPVFSTDISDWQPDPDQDPPEGGFLDPTVQAHPACPDGAGFAELRAVMAQLLPEESAMAATGRALHGWHQSHRFCAICGAESEAAMAGWQRNCQSCGGCHFPRTDPVVIMLVTRGNRLLLGRSPGWPEGMYSCLAGFVEPGETIEAAVRREVFEETGVHVGRVDYLASQPWPYPSSLMIGCLGEATSEDIEIDPAEIEDARWVTREELMRAMAGEHPEILPARPGAIARFLMVNWLADRLD